MLSKRTKTRLYVAIIRPTLTYRCEVWKTSSTTERNLRTFENKVWRKICGPVFDAGTGNWRRRYKTELQELMKMGPVTNFIKGQRIQWLGHIMRQKENDLLRAFEWIPQGKRPRDRPRKRCLDGIEEDPRKLDVKNWKDLVQDRDRWCDIVVAAEILRVAMPEEEEILLLRN